MTGRRAPTFRDVLRLDGAALRRAARGWRQLADLVRDQADALVPVLGAAEETWSGPAAAAASARARRLRDTLAAVRSPARGHEEALLTVAYSGDRLRQRAWELIAQARAAGIRVDLDGGVAPDGVPAELAPRAVESYRWRVDEVVAEAARLDREAIRRLAGHAPWRPGRSYGHVPEAEVPRTGTDPATVRTWWSLLPRYQRRYLLLRRPELVGPLDGLPAHVRDQANRTVLRRERERLADHPTAATLRGLTAVADRLARPTSDGRRAYLLDLSTTGSGRVVLALGNPDRAERILTYVPGTGAGLDRAGAGLRRTGRMAGDLAAMAQGTATVYWQGYDAPQTLLEAVDDGYAEEAADDLARFSDGLRVSGAGDIGGDARLTMVGHSYGSTVLGAAAADRLPVDDLVLVGSPGVGVDRAAELDIDNDPTRHVWSTTANDDPIRAVDLTAVFNHLSPVGWGIQRLLGIPDPLHGPDPSRPRFGGQVFGSDPGGHSGYWDADNVARENMARIAAGDYDAVAR